MSERLTRLERIEKMIEDMIDDRIKTIDKVFELDDPRPHGAKKLSAKEKIAYFAGLSPAQKEDKWAQMDEAERQEVLQGMAELERQGPI